MDSLFLEIQGFLRPDERDGTPLDIYYKGGGNLLCACQISLSSRCGNYTVEKSIGTLAFFDLQLTKNKVLDLALNIS